MLANKLGSKNVRGMFLHAQNIFANICCSIECCLIWPLCSPTIQLTQIKVTVIYADKYVKSLRVLQNFSTARKREMLPLFRAVPINMRKLLASIDPSTSLVAKWILNQRGKG